MAADSRMTFSELVEAHLALAAVAQWLERLQVQLGDFTSLPAGVLQGPTGWSAEVSRYQGNRGISITVTAPFADYAHMLAPRSELMRQYHSRHPDQVVFMLDYPRRSPEGVS